MAYIPWWQRMSPPTFTERFDLGGLAGRIGNRPKRVGKPGGVVEPGIEYYGTSKFKTETHIYPGGNAHSNWWSDKPGRNQRESIKTLQAKEKVKKFIIDNPDMNQKDGSKILGKKQAELVPADQWQNPGKKYDDVKAKARRDADKKWFKKYSKPSIETKTRGTMDIHKHHAGGLREKVTTENTMPLEARLNYKDIRKFEDAIDVIQNKQYKNNLNKNISIDEKKKIFELLNKEEAALRKANPKFSKYKSTLVFKESALSKTGFMHNEVMVAPELTYSEGKTGQKFPYKSSTEKEAKKIIEITKKGNTAAKITKKIIKDELPKQTLKKTDFTKKTVVMMRMRDGLAKLYNKIPLKGVRLGASSAAAVLDYSFFHYVMGVPSAAAATGAALWFVKNPKEAAKISSALMAMSAGEMSVDEFIGKHGATLVGISSDAVLSETPPREKGAMVWKQGKLEIADEMARGGLSGVDQYIINRGI